MNATIDLMEQLDSKGTFFGVHTEPVVSAAGTKMLKKQMIVRDDTNEPLGITSTGYNMATNEQILSSFCSAITHSGLNTAGAEAEVVFANGGAKTLVKFTFPEHVIALNGQESLLQIAVKNSYDLRWKYSTFAGALNMFCLNGQVFGDWVSSYEQYHNSKMSVQAGADRVVAMLSDFENTESRWSNMLATKITDAQAWKAICLYQENAAGFKEGIAAFHDPKRRQTVSTRLMDQYQDSEREDLGANAFAIYNTLTHHATHAAGRKGGEALSLDRRSQKVASVLKGDFWTDNVMGASAMVVH